MLANITCVCVPIQSASYRDFIATVAITWQTMNEVMMLPKWQAAASILLVFIITGRTQGKCKVLVFCKQTTTLWSYSKIWSDGYGNNSEKGWGETAACYTQGWQQTFKIELKTTRHRNCNLADLTLRQTPRAFRVLAISFVFDSLYFTDTPTEKVLELENHKTGRSRKDMS